MSLSRPGFDNQVCDCKFAARCRQWKPCPSSPFPEGEEWQYEPKWDGFRCLAFRDSETVELQSKSQQPLARYFPELVRALSELEAPRFVLDGEIAVSQGTSFSFDALLQRIHPAASRIQRLSVETPAIYIAFDLLADEVGTSLLELPLSARRPRLESFAEEFSPKAGASAYRRRRRISRKQRIGSRETRPLWSIIAKRRDLAYRSGERDGMQKIKRFRTADCVVGGFRYGKGKKTVGSLLLGLYDEENLLHHVGFTSSMPAADRPALTKKVEKLAHRPVSPVPLLAGPAAGIKARRTSGTRSSLNSSSKSATIM